MSNKPYKGFEPNWLLTPAPENSYRSIFRWGDPNFFKYPKESLYTLMKEKFQMTDDDFKAYSDDTGFDPVELPDHPVQLAPEHIDALKAIVGEQNLSTTDYDRLSVAYGATAYDLLRLRHKRIDSVPDVVLYPETSEQVEQIVAYSTEHHIPLYVYGGGWNRQDTGSGNTASQSDQCFVSHLICHKSAQESSYCNSQIKEGSEFCCLLRLHQKVLHQIAAGPESCSRLHGRIGKEGDQYVRCTFDPQDLPEAQGFRRHGFSLICLDLLCFCTLRLYSSLFFIRPRFPERQADKQDRRDHNLNHGYTEVSPAPAKPFSKAEAHDIWTCRCPDTPEAVKPAHMPGGIMKCHIVVQCRIHCAGTKTIRNRHNA